MAEDVNAAKSGEFRIFVQSGGSKPSEPYTYAGCMSLAGFQEDLGTGEPIYCPSPSVPGKYDIVGTTSPPPSLPTTDFTQRMSRLLNDFWWDFRKSGREFNMIVKGSNAGRPDDLDDFQSKIIARQSKLNSFNTGEFNGLAEDAALDLTGSLQLQFFDRFLPISFGEKADSTTFSEALDGLYAETSDPGEADQKAYVLTTTIAASPSLASQIVHTTDGWATSATDNVTTLSTSAGNALAQIGRRLVVVSSVDGAHHYKLLATIDAGTAGGWTRVAGGYVASKGPRAIWSKSPSETFVAAAGGYIYLMSNPASAVTVLTDGALTVQNLNDIQGKGRTIVAVGASNAVLASSNNGRTWALITGPAVGVALNTVEVISEDIWFIGTANGKSFYTLDGGTNWVENTPDSSITEVNRIRFVDEVVGYMTVEISGGVRVYRTADNGYSWHSAAPYVENVPTADHYNFIAFPQAEYNLVLVGGLRISGTDGILSLGAA